jgi:hypothetical protein
MEAEPRVNEEELVRESSMQPVGATSGDTSRGIGVEPALQSGDGERVPCGEGVLGDDSSGRGSAVRFVCFFNILRSASALAC